VSEDERRRDEGEAGGPGPRGDVPLPRTERHEAPLYLARYHERKARARGRQVTDAADEADEGTPLYLRRFRARRSAGDSVQEPSRGTAPPPRVIEQEGRRWTEAWAHSTRQKELIPPPEHPSGGGSEPPATPRGRTAATVHFVRHGETQGYSIDGGLTPMGRWQAHRRGHDLSKSVREGEVVRLVCADTARAWQTAEHLRRGVEDGLELWARDAKIIGPETREEFRNFQVWSPTAGLRDPTAAFREFHAVMERYERVALGDRPLWLVEMDRFWRTQDGGGDPIHYWLTIPLAHFEPPALCVLRFWLGVVEIAKEADEGTRIVCATHSGPMRAFATWAFGHDPGEPYHTEEVVVKVRRNLSEASVTFRNRAQAVHVPPVDRWPVWWEPGWRGTVHDQASSQTRPGERGDPGAVVAGSDKNDKTDPAALAHPWEG
jgi:broad specificity phosphatase PhoE